ncbi:MAG TPA: pilus assembly protein TadG-related protein [Chloroflexota bacterium]|nr:pilus assembly protein TadG-related protein [Chloroflexota bacterium]
MSAIWTLVRARQRGTALAWVAVMMPFFLSIVGLTIDSGTMFKERRDMQALADGAARAGAMQIDQAAYRASSGSKVVLDLAAARGAALSYLAGQPSGLTVNVNATPRQVVVQLQREVPTAFLRIVHIDSAQIGASSVAVPRHGVATEDRS